MTEPQKEPEKINLHISFQPAPPKPRKIRRWSDLCWITIACALLATGLKTPIIFPIATCICVVMYIVWGPTKPREPKS